MVAYKAADVASVLKSPKPTIVGYLVYGTDTSQVSDTAKQLAGKLAAKTQPPAEILRVNEQDLSENPGRISVEMQTIPMFGSAPVIWVKSAQNLRPEDIAEATGVRGTSAKLIVEAGNLPKTSKLRQLFEATDNLAVLPCYGDDAGSVPALLDRQLSASGLKASPEARQFINVRLGSSVAGARAEIDKLVLFAHGASEITLDMADLALGDVAESAAENVINAALGRAAGTAITAFHRLAASGFQPQGLLAILNMHLQKLYRVTSAIEAGDGFAVAVRQLRPPLHFKAERTFAAQCRDWRAEQIGALISLTQEVTLKSRLNPPLEDMMIEHLIIEIAGMPRKSDRKS